MVRHYDHWCRVQEAQLRCMWTLGVPLCVITIELNRATEKCVAQHAGKRGFKRPEWLRGWMNRFHKKGKRK